MIEQYTITNDGEVKVQSPNGGIDGFKQTVPDADIYKSFFENQIMERKLKDLIAADVSRTEKQVWARHILVDNEIAAITIIEKLKNG